MDFVADFHPRIARPPSEVFEAVVDPDRMTRYFADAATGRLVPGARVSWRFTEFGVEIPVEVTAVEPGRRLVFLWGGARRSEVEMTSEPCGEDAATVGVVERGLGEGAAGLAACVGQAQGWTHMILCMKAWLEYGIDLRAGGVGKLTQVGQPTRERLNKID